jgi:hypothetical protein
VGEPAFGYVAIMLVVAAAALFFLLIAVMVIRRAVGSSIVHPTRSSRRRVAKAIVVLGVFALGFRFGAVVYGADIDWLELFVSSGLMVAGLLQLRELRKERTHKSAL